MERAQPKESLLVRYQINKSTRCSIHLLGSNMIREVISYLTFPEYLNFTMTCKKFWKYIQDSNVTLFDRSKNMHKLNTLYEIGAEDIAGSIMESMIEANHQSGKLPTLAFE